jgi:acetolactate synthase I/II/III large subunit
LSKAPSGTTVADAYLRILRQRGIEVLFANAGTDFPPIVEALSLPEAAEMMPRSIVVAHEQTAISMAHGYWLVTGRPQAVMVHVSVGTANAVCGLLNAARENVPIFFTAGRSPLTEAGLPGSRSVPIHWAQEMFDQAGMVREAVKWDYELRGGYELDEIVTRALAIAESHPKGPVYLSLPRETLAAPAGEGAAASSPRIRPSSAPFPDPEAVSQAAELIAAAKRPLIVAGRVGQDPEAVPVLAEFADRFGTPVVEFWSSYLGLPSDHPMHLGYDVHPDLPHADLIIALDCDVPWLPDRAAPNGDCRVIQIGPDPLFSRYPIRNFAAALAITATCKDALQAIITSVCAMAGETGDTWGARRKEIAAVHETRRRKAVEAALADPAPGGRMSKAFVSLKLSEAKAEDAVLFNEYPVRRDVMTFRHPGTFFDQCSAAGLGWGVGAALGAKLALPERQVIAAIGDGSYIFANPPACHQAAAALDLPILTVVFNNERWDAVRMATEMMYPDGAALAANRVPLTSLQPAPAYELYAQASGGYGERVEQPEELEVALARALDAVANGKQALLNIICA